MSVKTKRDVFESHGKEFESKAEAEKYDALCESKEAFVSAQRDFQKKLSESQKTADGVPFELGSYHDYLAIVWHFGGISDLRKVSFMHYNWQMREDEIGVSIQREGGDSSWYRISKLYHYERNARKALAAEHEKELATIIHQMNVVRASVSLPDVASCFKGSDLQ